MLRRTLPLHREGLLLGLALVGSATACGRRRASEVPVAASAAAAASDGASGDPRRAPSDPALAGGSITGAVCSVATAWRQIAPRAQRGFELVRAGDGFALTWFDPVETTPRSSGALLDASGATTRALAREPVAPDASAESVEMHRIYPVERGGQIHAGFDATIDVDEPAEDHFHYEARCGLLRDAFAVVVRGTERITPGTMYQCMTVPGSGGLVVGTVTPPGGDFDFDFSLDRIGVVAVAPGATARTTIPAPALALPVQGATAPNGESTILSFEQQLGWRGASAFVPGTGALVAIVIRGALYTAWFSPAAAPLGGARRVVLPGGAQVEDVSLAANGQGAVLVASAGTPSRLWAARVAPGAAPEAPRPLELGPPAAPVAAPALLALSDGTFLAGGTQRAPGAASGALIVARLGPDLRPIAPPLALGQGDVIRLAARDDAVLVAGATLAPMPLDTPYLSTGALSVRALRCPAAGNLPAAPAPTPAGEDVNVAWTGATAPAPSAAAGGTPPAASAPVVGCVANPEAAFHLRPTPTLASVGVELQPQGVVVLRRGTLQRGGAWIYEVRTHTESTGWVFLQPSELLDGCPAAWRR